MQKITEFEICPKCGMTCISKQPQGKRICCNRVCRHQWTVKEGK